MIDLGRKKHGNRFAAALTPAALRHRAESAAAGLPALIAAAEKAVVTLHSGEHRQRKTGSGENFWQFREYDPGDRPQDIDWRQSAKGDHFYVRQKEWQTAQTVLFWVQNDLGMTLHTGRAMASKHDSAIVLSLALGILLTRAGEHIGSMADPRRTGHGESSLHRLGAALLRQEKTLSPGPQMPVMETLPAASSLVLCGDFMGPPESLDMVMGDLSRQAPQGLLIQILDPSEMDLSYNGHVIFTPMDASREFPVASVASVRKAYQDRLADHIHSIRTIARRHGYGHVLHVTGDDPRTALSAAWHVMDPRPGLQETSR